MTVRLSRSLHGCPCGYYGDPIKQCACSQANIQKYLQRISGPLLDRIDIHMEVPRLPQDEMLQSRGDGETSQTIRDRVVAARDIQKQRYDGTDLQCNAHMGSKQIRHYCEVGKDVKDLLKQAISALGLSARAYDRILKLSRTVADLEGAQDIG